MAQQEELVVVLRADTDEAKKELAAFAKSAGKKDIKVGLEVDTTEAKRDIDGLMSKVDKVAGPAATILLKTNAEDIALDIARLISELDKLDAADPQVTVKTDEINQLVGDLDRVSSKVKEVNDTPISVDTGHARQGLDDIGKSADSSKNALANMIGNATQDLGSLGGVAGSAGVAIGQMAEFMADARLEGEGFGSVVKNFAGVAGPIAGISIGIAAVTAAFNAYQDSVKAAEERLKALQSAQEDLNADKQAEAANKIADSYERLFGVLGEAGVSAGEVADFITGVSDGFAGADLAGKDFNGTMAALEPVMRGNATELERTAHEVQRARKEWENSGQTLKDHKKLIDDITVALGGQIGAEKVLNNERGFGFQANRQAFEMNEERLHQLDLEHDKVVQQQEDAAAQKKLMEEVTKGLNSQALAYEEAGASTAAFGDALDELDFGGLNQSLKELKLTDAFDQLKETIPDLKKDLKDLKKAGIDVAGVDFTPDSFQEIESLPEPLLKVTRALGNFKSAAQVALKDAFDTKGVQGFQDKAAELRGEMERTLIPQFKALGLSGDQAAEQVRQLEESLGILPDQVETTIKLKDIDQAIREVESYGAIIDQLPIEQQLQIRTALNDKDPQKALDILNAFLVKSGLPPIQLHTAIPPTEESKAAAEKAAQDAQDRANDLPVEVPFTDPPADDPNSGASAGEAGAGEAQDAANENPVEIPMDADTSQAQAAYNAFKFQLEHSNIDIPVDFFGNFVGGLANGGDVPAGGGLYRVGEHGEEAVLLPGRAHVFNARETRALSIAPTSVSAPVPQTIIHNHFTFNVPPTINVAEVGGRIVEAITAFERRSGKRWRAA